MSLPLVFILKNAYEYPILCHREDSYVRASESSFNPVSKTPLLLGLIITVVACLKADWSYNATQLRLMSPDNLFTAHFAFLQHTISWLKNESKIKKKIREMYVCWYLICGQLRSLGATIVICQKIDRGRKYFFAISTLYNK